jgi:RNA polymerase sigma-70 factor, ECF subfamily
VLTSDVTALIERHRNGDAAAFDELMAALYDELRRLAAYHLRAERDGHTLQPTALVHEAYLRLCNAPAATWQTRAHFLALAARVMRNILVDHARARSTGKRAGRNAQVELDEALAVAAAQQVDLVELDEVLGQLAALDPDLCRVVELRCFGGLTVAETAEVLGVSPATVDREWATARAWLRQRLAPS